MRQAAGWHRADIVAALHKRGMSLRRLALQHGRGESTLRSALHVPRSPSNRIIAEFLGVPIHELWPAWFDRHGRLKGPRNPAHPRRGESSQKRSAA
jgi:Ner family transcriptional regulator